MLQSLLSENEQVVRETPSEILLSETAAITSMFIEERIGRRQMVSHLYMCISPTPFILWLTNLWMCAQLFAGTRNGQIIVQDIMPAP